MIIDNKKVKIFDKKSIKELEDSINKLYDTNEILDIQYSTYIINAINGRSIVHYTALITYIEYNSNKNDKYYDMSSIDNIIAKTSNISIVNSMVKDMDKTMKCATRSSRYNK